MGFAADCIHTCKESVTYIEIIQMKAQKEQKTEKENKVLMI